MEKENLPKGEIVIYTSADGKISLDTKLENETIWLTQDMMAKLFETTPQNITMHIKNIYDDEELEQNSTCKDFLQVRNEGKRTVSRRLTHYNLDMILSVGYRIKSIPKDTIKCIIGDIIPVRCTIFIPSLKTERSVSLNRSF